MNYNGYQICESVIADLRKKYSTSQLQAMAKSKAKTPQAKRIKMLATRASHLKK